MKNTSLKCENCGSVSFNRISDDIFECSYCGAKIQNNNSIKNEFIEDLKGNKNKKIKFVKAKFNEDEFFKHAISHLLINQYSPSDLLEKAKFGIVEYDYEFFAVLDVDFSLITVNNETTFNDGKKSIKISSDHQMNCKLKQTICFGLENNMDDYFAKEVINLAKGVDPTVFSLKGEKGSNVKYPKQQEIEHKIDKVIEECKKELLSDEINKASNRCIHNIRNIEIIALPIYKLQYEYNGKKYTISTSANKLNFVGDLPVTNNLILEEVKKKTMCFFLLSIGMSLAAIIFAYINTPRIIPSDALIKMIVIAFNFFLNNFCINR